jgi:hypothetical protein
MHQKGSSGKNSTILHRLHNEHFSHCKKKVQEERIVQSFIDYTNEHFSHCVPHRSYLHTPNPLSLIAPTIYPFVLSKMHSSNLPLRTLEDYYKTIPSHKPTQLCCSIELQPSNILNVQTNKNMQKQKDNKEIRTFNICVHS